MTKIVTPEKKETQYLKCLFSTDEKLDLGSSLATAQRDLEDVERAKASAMADFTSQIKRLKAEIELTGRKVRDGFEYRDVPCLVLDYDRKAKRKTLVRTDTGEEVVLPMSVADLQAQIPGLE